MRWKERCSLHHADFAVTLKACADVGGADLVLTSPPYCDARDYGMGCSWGMDDYHRLGVAVFDALRPGGHALINVDAPVRVWRRLCEPCGRMTRHDRCPHCGAKTSNGPTERGFHPWQLQEDWAEEIGFRVPDRLVFGRMGIPGEYRGRFRNDCEPLLWFQKPGGDPWMDRWALAEESKHGAYAGGTSCSWGRDAMVYETNTGKASEEGKTHRGTFWDYGPCGKGHTGAPDIEAQNHPARWPYKLAEDIVRCFCPPDGLCCDPFVGAGTSAAAALEHGRRFVGGDLGSRQDNEDNQRRGLDAVPWVTVTARVLTERFKQERLF